MRTGAGQEFTSCLETRRAGQKSSRRWRTTVRARRKGLQERADAFERWAGGGRRRTVCGAETDTTKRLAALLLTDQLYFGGGLPDGLDLSVLVQNKSRVSCTGLGVL